jgi:hypothetical protein
MKIVEQSLIFFFLKGYRWVFCHFITKEKGLFMYMRHGKMKKNRKNTLLHILLDDHLKFLSRHPIVVEDPSTPLFPDIPDSVQDFFCALSATCVG